MPCSSFVSSLNFLKSLHSKKKNQNIETTVCSNSFAPPWIPRVFLNRERKKKNRLVRKLELHPSTWLHEETISRDVIQKCGSLALHQQLNQHEMRMSSVFYRPLYKAEVFLQPRERFLEMPDSIFGFFPHFSILVWAFDYFWGFTSAMGLKHVQYKSTVAFFFLMHAHSPIEWTQTPFIAAQSHLDPGITHILGS